MEPQELLPAMPPMVQRDCVDGSTGKNSPCGFRLALSCDSTVPGSTVTVLVLVSRASVLRRYFVQSRTIARLTVWPHWLVPPPRGSTGTPASRAIASTAWTSAVLRGTTTPIGCIW